MTPAPQLDDEIAAVLATLPDWVVSTLKLEDIAEWRAMFGGLTPAPEPSEAVETVDELVPGSDGVRVAVHRPRAGSGSRPCVYWIHGGGLVLGGYRDNDAMLQSWCTSFDCVTASVEYRLAPEHPYPAPLDDCYAGLEWVHEHAEELGVDPDRIGVAGGSAGACLAAALALLARDRGEIPLAFQFLAEPMLDDRQITESSRWDVPTWNPESNRTGWRAYLGALYGGDVPSYAAAARETNLAGLPATFVAVGGVDGFLDESVDYAQRLMHARVPTELHVYPGAPHGFRNLAPTAAVAQRATGDVTNWLARTLEASPRMSAARPGS